MRTLTFDPLVPVALWAALAVTGIAVLIAYGVRSRFTVAASRRVLILLFMTVCFALPLVLLLNPTWIEKIPPPAGKPLLTILVDASASMAMPDGPDGKPRLAAATNVVEKLMKPLSESFDVRLRAITDQVQSTDLEALAARSADGSGTDLATAIVGSLEDRPQGQAMLLISDGIHNASPMSEIRAGVEKAKAMAAPIYTVAVGTNAEVRDLEVQIESPQELAFVGQDVSVAVSVRQRGLVSDRTRLSLRLDGKEIDTKDVSLVANQRAECEFQVKQENRGLYRYEVQAEALPGEVTPINNSATLLLRVVDEPVRVLLLEGKPYWDTKFLVRTLASDASVELTSIVKMTEDRYLERIELRAQVEGSSPAGDSVTTNASDAPRTPQWRIRRQVEDLLNDPAQLAQFRVIVLGRDTGGLLSNTAAANLKQWIIDTEGSLVCFRGAPAAQLPQRLNELLPVQWAPTREVRFRVHFTESGQGLRWLPTAADGDQLAAMPSLATIAVPQKRKPLAVVLAAREGADATAEPAISYQPYGGGRVVVVEGSGMWRWAFLSPQYQRQDDVYGRLWRSLMRWLVANVGLLPSQQMDLKPDKVIFATNETATGTLLLRNEPGEGSPPQIELSGEALPDSRLLTAVPTSEVAGQYRIAFGKLDEGRYVARVVGASESEIGTKTAFEVRGPLQERLDVAVRSDVMSMIAEQSGGAVLDGADPVSLTEQFQKHLAAAMPVHTERIMAWDRWWILVSVMGMWAISWGIRRRSGLV